MEKSLTAWSFIVRIYRADTEDNRKITGQVEALDGSMRLEPFRDIEELAGLLNNWSAATRKRVRKAKKRTDLRGGREEPKS